MRSENRSAESALLTEERIALRSRPLYRCEVCFAVVLTARAVFPDSSAWFLRESVLSNRRDNLRGVADGSEEILKRPAAGQVNADATSGFADLRPDLEQLNAQRFDLGGAHRQG